MQYPLISEYLAAIRETNDNLDKLSHLVPVLDKYGEPYRSSGAFAVAVVCVMLTLPLCRRLR